MLGNLVSCRTPNQDARKPKFEWDITAAVLYFRLSCRLSSLRAIRRCTSSWLLFLQGYLAFVCNQCSSTGGRKTACSRFLFIGHFLALQGQQLRGPNLHSQALRANGHRQVLQGAAAKLWIQSLDLGEQSFGFRVPDLVSKGLE